MGDILSYIKTFGTLNFLLVVLTLMDPLGLGHLFGYMAIGLMIIKKDMFKNNLDSFFLLLLIFSSTYSLFYLLNPWKGIQYFFIYFLSPPFFYLWGKQISMKLKNQVQGFVILVLLGVLYSLPALISVVLNIYEGGFAQPDRNIPMFWGGSPVNATGMAGFLMFNMCIPGLLIAGYNVLSKKMVLILVMIFILSLASVLRLGSRTQLGILIIALLLALIFTGRNLSLRQNIVVYFILVGVVFLITKNISFDLDSDLFTSFAGRMKDDGAEDLAGGGGRVGLWKKSIDYMWKYPLGWDLEAFGYSHNLWLDTLRVGGILSCSLLILYFINVFGLLFRIFFDKALEISNRLIFLVYLIAFLSVFMVEPGIDGSYSMFLFFCLFTGIMYEAHQANRKVEYRDDAIQ